MVTTNATQTEIPNKTLQYPAISAVALKLACFGSDEHALWFMQVKAQFIKTRNVS